MPMYQGDYKLYPLSVYMYIIFILTKLARKMFNFYIEKISNIHTYLLNKSYCDILLSNTQKYVQIRNINIDGSI